MGDSIRKKAFVYQMNNKGGYKEYAAFIAGAESRDGEVAGYKMALGTAKVELKAKELIIKSLQNPWISVNDGLPEKIKDSYRSKVCLVITDTAFSHALAYYNYNEGKWFYRPKNVCTLVTHWMPLPKLNKL